MGGKSCETNLQNYFHLAKITTHSPLIQLLEPTILLFFPMNFTTLGTAYQWNHTVFNFFWWINFTWHNVLKAHLCCSMCQDLLFFLKLKYYVLCVHQMFLIHPSVDGHLGYHHLLAIMINATDMSEYVSVLVPIFNSFGYLSRSRIARSDGNFLIFWETDMIFSHPQHDFIFPAIVHKGSKGCFHFL